MIRLTAEHYEQILDHCRQGLPDEACGILGGSMDGGIRIVKRVYLLNNVDHSPEHFSMDPQEQFQAIKDMRTRGWIMLGNFHSHPATPSRPSQEDERLAFDPQVSYLILSLMDEGHPVLKSFRIEAGSAAEEKIEIVREME